MNRTEKTLIYEHFLSIQVLENNVVSFVRWAAYHGPPLHFVPVPRSDLGGLGIDEKSLLNTAYPEIQGPIDHIFLRLNLPAIE